MHVPWLATTVSYKLNSNCEFASEQRTEWLKVEKTNIRKSSTEQEEKKNGFNEMKQESNWLNHSQHLPMLAVSWVKET